MVQEMSDTNGCAPTATIVSISVANEDDKQRRTDSEEDEGAEHGQCDGTEHPGHGADGAR